MHNVRGHSGNLLVPLVVSFHAAGNAILQGPNNHNITKAVGGVYYHANRIGPGIKLVEQIIWTTLDAFNSIPFNLVRVAEVPMIISLHFIEIGLLENIPARDWAGFLLKSGQQQQQS